MVVFIVVPNNRGLANYVKAALSCFDNISKDYIIQSRGEDIPFIVEELAFCNKKVVGLTGSDLLREYKLSNNGTKLVTLKKISWVDKNAIFGKPVLCLLGAKGKKLDEMPKSIKVCINSKYKNIAGNYLKALEDAGYNLKKIYLSGSTEAAYSSGLSDLVVDIVYTGASIKNANLEIYDRIFESDFVVIGAKND